MTVIERIGECIRNTDLETDNIEKLICIAYYIGREEATKKISDKYNELIKYQRRRARECRYHNMAMQIIGDINYIYSADYAGDVTATFGSDETEV